MDRDAVHKEWFERAINGMDHFLTIEFLVGGYDYVRDDMWIGRS